MMKKVLLVTVALLALACSGRNGHRGNAVGPAWLDTIYLRYRVPAVYLMFIADTAAGGGRGAWVGGGTFGSWNAELHKTYVDYKSGERIEAPPVVIRRATLWTAGRSFDLTDGNVFVLHLGPKGSMAVTQLHEQRTPDETTKDIVTLIKSKLLQDKQVQALPGG